MPWSSRATAAIWLLSLVLGTAPGVLAQETKPLLSDEIRRVLDESGAEAAQARFEEIHPENADKYELDVQGLMALAGERIQANDLESGQVVFGMVSAIQTAKFVEHAPEVAAAADAEQQERDADEEASVRTGPGESRDDVKRFAGFYGVSTEQDGPAPKNLFIQDTCDGYLVAGMTWGDASPWHLRSVGPTSFDHSGEGSSFDLPSFTMEFEVDGEGHTTTMIHDLGDVVGLPARLSRVADLRDPQCFFVERGGR